VFVETEDQQTDYVPDLVVVRLLKLGPGGDAVVLEPPKDGHAALFDEDGQVDVDKGTRVHHVEVESIEGGHQEVDVVLALAADDTFEVADCQENVGVIDGLGYAVEETLRVAGASGSLPSAAALRGCGGFGR